MYVRLVKTRGDHHYLRKARCRGDGTSLTVDRLYQIGALIPFLNEAGLPLNHIKPHGMWVSAVLICLGLGGGVFSL